MNEVTKTCQEARRAQPTAGEQKEQCQLQADAHEENNVSKKLVTREKALLEVINTLQQNKT